MRRALRQNSKLAVTVKETMALRGTAKLTSEKRITHLENLTNPKRIHSTILVVLCYLLA
jgi:hypothetical protein